MYKVFIKKIISVLLVVIICGVPTCIYAAEKEETIKPEDKISEDLYKEFDRLGAKGKELSKEKIPVWVWYKDIDQKQVDREVEEQTGLTQENLAVDFKMPSHSLIDALKQEETNSQNQMEKYLQKTSVGRKLEEQRTNEYIKTRRKICRNKYVAESANIAKAVMLNDNDVKFKSRYAPTIIVAMTRQQISYASKNRKIELIDLFSNEIPTLPSEFSVLDSSGVIKVLNKIGLYGEGVKVGILDGGVPGSNINLKSENITNINASIVDDHATRMAITIAGTNGVTPKAKLYCTDWRGSLYNNIELLLNEGVSVVNMCLNWSRYGNMYTSRERWMDHLAVQHNVDFLIPAGNSGPISDIGDPGLAYNVITVGGYNDHETGAHIDDSFYPDSSFVSTGGCQKPDIISPENLPGGGTCNATAQTTGIAALLLELKPSLGFQPQTLKAILMASCQRKVKSPAGVAAETMEQGLTERQGAGAIDAWNAVCIVAQENYGYGEVTSATEKRNFVQPAYGADHMNVSITWLRENTLPESNHVNGKPTVGTQQDLDLSVYRNKTLVGSSANANSSTEMAYFPLSASESRYQIRVSKEDLTNTETVRYGYAWSTDNMTFRENLTGTDNPEGIYYIRNQANANGAYLTVDEQTGRISQEAFTGAANQQWVSRKTGTDPFTIRTNSGAYPGYLSISGQTIAQIRQDAEQYVTFGGNGYDNTYGIQLYGLSSSMSRSLTALNGAAQSAGAVWQHIGIPERFIWYFEPVGYKRGDVNKDGKIAAADALLAQKYVNKQVNFDAAQEYLGDMNNDGQVNLTDISLIQGLITA